MTNGFRPAAAGGEYGDFCPADRRRFVLLAAILASAMGFIDGTVVSIAVPAIRSTLDASLADAQWVSNAYMLVLSSAILAGGAAGDRYGLRRMFALGIGLFVLASALCAIAPSAQWLIGARAVQGLGAAVMVPGSLAIISKAYPREERGQAIGIWAAASAVTTAAGPVLGGTVLSIGGPEMWRLIFAINLPVGFIALYFLLARVPPDRAETSRLPDWQGAILATSGLGLVAWGLTGPEGEEGRVEIPHMLVFCAAGLAMLAVFVLHQKHAANPMLPLRLFASVRFNAANLLTFFLYFALSTILFYLPMTLISAWGLSERDTGFIFLPLSLAIALASGPVGKLAGIWGPAPLIGTGSFLVALAYALLAAGIGMQSFWLHVFPCMCLMAAGMALVVAPLSTAVMSVVTDEDTGKASGINNAVSRIAGLVAVAGMGLVASVAYGLDGGTAGFGAPDAQGSAHLQASNFAFATLAWCTAAMSAMAGIIAFLGLQWRR